MQLTGVLVKPVVTAQETVPVGSGSVERLPATSAVRSVVPPKVGEAEEVSEIVGVKLFTPKVIVLEVTAL